MLGFICNLPLLHWVVISNLFKWFNSPNAFLPLIYFTHPRFLSTQNLPLYVFATWHSYWSEHLFCHTSSRSTSFLMFFIIVLLEYIVYPFSVRLLCSWSDARFLLLLPPWLLKCFIRPFSHFPPHFSPHTSSTVTISLLLCSIHAYPLPSSHQPLSLFTPSILPHSYYTFHSITFAPAVYPPLVDESPLFYSHSLYTFPPVPSAHLDHTEWSLITSHRLL